MHLINHEKFIELINFLGEITILLLSGFLTKINSSVISLTHDVFIVVFFHLRYFFGVIYECITCWISGVDYRGQSFGDSWLFDYDIA